MEKEAVRRHLDECEQCRQLLAEIERLDRLVADKASLPDGDYWEQSAQAIERRLDTVVATKITDISRFRWTGMTGKIVAVAASVAVLAFIGLYQTDILRDVPQTPRILETPAAKDDEAVEKQVPEPKMSRRGDVEGIADEETAVREMPPIVEAEADLAGAGSIEKKEAESQDDDMVSDDVQPAAPEKTVQQLLENVSGMAKGRSEQVYTKATLTKVDSVSLEPRGVESKKAGPYKMEGVTVTASAKSQVAMEPSSGVAMRDADKTVETDAAAETVVSWVVSPPTDTSLDGWRQRRDSLQTLHADLTSPHMALADAKARRTRPEVTIEDVERQLLRSYYEIARLTPDVQERRDAINYLNRHTEKPDACCKDVAEEYLRELGE